MARPAFIASAAQVDGAYEAAKRGFVDTEIAKIIGVRYGTFKKHKWQFIDAIKKGRSEGVPIIVDDLENALIKKAVGYEYKEVQRKLDKDGNVVEKRETTKHYPADTALLIFALCNYAPERFQSVNRQKSFVIEDDATVEQLLSEMAKHTPTPYAINPANDAGAVSGGSVGEAERQD